MNQSPKNILRIIFTVFGVFILVILFLIAAALFVLNNYLKKANLNLSDLSSKTVSAISLKNQLQGQRYNIILLGLDKRDDEFEKTQTTDTIMLVSLNYQKPHLDIISLPRDLWSYNLNSKINQVYPLSLSQKDKFGYIKDKYSEITGQKIDKVLVFTTSNLIDFTNLIGGVDIYLEKGFTDNQYPNPDYIKNPSPKIPIYKTVSFPSGWVKLNSSNITEFVRSRKSAQTAAEGGTDIGRIYRQQLLIDAIMAKIKTPSFYRSPQTLINLYNFWHQKIETDIKDDDLISLALKMKKQALNLSISKTTLPVGATAQDGVIYHPDTFINKQWVFIPSLKDYSSVHNFINTALSQ